MALSVSLPAAAGQPIGPALPPGWAWEVVNGQKHLVQIEPDAPTQEASAFPDGPGESATTEIDFDAPYEGPVGSAYADEDDAEDGESEAPDGDTSAAQDGDIGNGHSAKDICDDEPGSSTLGGAGGYAARQAEAHRDLVENADAQAIEYRDRAASARLKAKAARDMAAAARSDENRAWWQQQAEDWDGFADLLDDVANQREASATREEQRANDPVNGSIAKTKTPKQVSSIPANPSEPTPATTHTPSDNDAVNIDESSAGTPRPTFVPRWVLRDPDSPYLKDPVSSAGASSSSSDEGPGSVRLPNLNREDQRGRTLWLSYNDHVILTIPVGTSEEYEGWPLGWLRKNNPAEYRKVIEARLLPNQTLFEFNGPDGLPIYHVDENVIKIGVSADDPRKYDIQKFALEVANGEYNWVEFAWALNKANLHQHPVFISLDRELVGTYYENPFVGHGGLYVYGDDEQRKMLNTLVQAYEPTGVEFGQQPLPRPGRANRPSGKGGGQKDNPVNPNDAADVASQPGTTAGRSKGEKSNKPARRYDPETADTLSTNDPDYRDLGDTRVVERADGNTEVIGGAQPGRRDGNTEAVSGGRRAAGGGDPDVFTASDRHRIQIMDARAKASRQRADDPDLEGPGLTSDDMDWLQERLGADPDYFDLLENNLGPDYDIPTLRDAYENGGRVRISSAGADSPYTARFGGKPLTASGAPIGDQPHLPGLDPATAAEVRSVLNKIRRTDLAEATDCWGGSQQLRNTAGCGTVAEHNAKSQLTGMDHTVYEFGTGDSAVYIDTRPGMWRTHFDKHPEARAAVEKRVPGLPARLESGAVMTAEEFSRFKGEKRLPPSNMFDQTPIGLGRNSQTSRFVISSQDFRAGSNSKRWPRTVADRQSVDTAGPMSPDPRVTRARQILVAAIGQMSGLRQPIVATGSLKGEINPAFGSRTDRIKRINGELVAMTAPPVETNRSAVENLAPVPPNNTTALAVAPAAPNPVNKTKPGSSNGSAKANRPAVVVSTATAEQKPTAQPVEQRPTSGNTPSNEPNGAVRSESPTPAKTVAKTLPVFRTASEKDAGALSD